MDEKLQKCFFELVKTGLWEGVNDNLDHNLYEDVDWNEVQRLAEEQSVVGLVAAGIDVFKTHVPGFKVAKADAMQFIGQTLQLEQRNQAMNCFIGMLVEKLRKASINTVLVKGQGVAQCYEKPLWRSCGDVDLFLDAENYRKAKVFLAPLAAHVEEEDATRLHLGMTIDPWVVELHGTMRGGLSGRINSCLDDVQRDVFINGGVRTWDNDGVDVFLPNPDNDVIIIFTHFIGHFYVGGIGLRQICDWCRLLWMFRSDIDSALLERRLQWMGLMAEWKAFAAFAVEYLGMPEEAMPFYAPSASFQNKARWICRLILRSGNFGHNQDQSYRSRYPRLLEKSITFFRRFGEFVRLSTIFPGNAPRFFVTYVCGRTKAVL